MKLKDYERQIAALKAENTTLRQEIESRNNADQGIVNEQARKGVKVWTEDFTHTNYRGQKKQYIKVYSSLSPERGKDQLLKSDMSQTMRALGGRFFFATEKNGNIPFWSIPAVNRETLNKVLTDQYTLTIAGK